MLLLPVSRTWSLDAFCEALDASDVPKDDALLVIDAPGCDSWGRALRDMGFTVEQYETGNPEPPNGRFERRERHLFMRLLTREIVAGAHRILFLEDDTLIPPDTWSRLSALLDSGYQAASGLQRGRHGDAQCGVWRRHPVAAMQPLKHEGALHPFRPYSVASADACGHFCLMTTGDAYANAHLDPIGSEPIDLAHTKNLAPIGVDPEVFCGHLLPDGTVLL